MDLRRLELLVDLSRLGSMRAVAHEHATTTSTVSQQLAALARDVDATLLEPDGRRVRLTPAGRRLAERAVRILAEVESARSELDPHAEPTGTVRVGGFGSALRRTALPAVEALRESAPGLRFELTECEPPEAYELLLHDDLDLALTYDYQVAPASVPTRLVTHPLWQARWGVAVPAAEAHLGLADLGDRAWITNSRNTADEIAVRFLGGLAGIAPRVTHRMDSLDLVCDLVRDGHGVGLVPQWYPLPAGVALVTLDPPVEMTAYAVHQEGRDVWLPLRTLLDAVGAPARAAAGSTS
ncbi:LysR family transcriptional regulator [Janibacter melonis]|uniref:LysR family transcriptional regulator n=1 Tax=Janibacter melonis TaxID=262209 RepID=UPI00174911FE|nr:LysR family transcriptional regulator [Janibacter melonis]